jgi:hypothetical protein
MAFTKEWDTELDDHEWKHIIWSDGSMTSITPEGYLMDWSAPPPITKPDIVRWEPSA